MAAMGLGIKPFCYLLIIIVLITLSSSSTLYSAEDPLWELNSSNFESLVYGKDHAWIIQFYNSWCGHCIRFSFFWKLFAKDTKMWRKVIDVGVINCNDEENLKLCRQYDVKGFPTIRFFWRNVGEKDMGIDLEGHRRDIPYIENSTLHFIESNWDKGVPSDWPDLSPLKLTSLNEIEKSSNMKVEGTYLFVEDEESIVGRLLTMDFSFQTEVIIRRVLTNNTELLNDLGPNLYNGSVPVIYKINPSGKAEVFMRFSNDTGSFEIRNQIFKAIVGHPRFPEVEVATAEPTNSTESGASSVYMVDLENAVYNSLRQEVGMTKVIDGEKFSALKSYLFMLKVYFPGSEPVISYLSKLYNWISYRKRSVTGEEFVDIMNQYQTETEYLPKMRDYVGCKGSELKYRGYPCSLWTLFHTITIQANNEFKRSLGYEETAAQALFAIRDYVKYFFTCHECVENFLKMAKDLEAKVKSSENAVLWLWQAHNEANNRLAGDETEDPKHPKIQFPSKEACPLCRKTGETFRDIVWDQEQVLQFLSKIYGKQNIKQGSVKVVDLVPSDRRINNSAMGSKLFLSPVLTALLVLFYCKKHF
ncbi:sulfhydryl oxidase 1 isoform X2 [Parasteatoda tepidariorum]|uniref:sulfhydryl oxidase 1 isoform X2 n=1 Tax=Parasteatoda tepidariorum TaxID=114398 RepID=UPI00077F8B5A|nr:sulfhydryl oxidase 1 isoform X2 [Parasteatoda tepidariorum]